MAGSLGPTLISAAYILAAATALVHDIPPMAGAGNPAHCETLVLMVVAGCCDLPIHPCRRLSGGAPENS